MQPYRGLIAATQRSIEQRAKRLRLAWLIIGALVLLALPLLVLLRDLTALSILLWVMPVAGGFFTTDAMVLHNWRAQIIQAWVGKAVELNALGAALSAHPQLPQQTVRAMLETLPLFDDLATEQTLPAATREIIAQVVLADSTSRNRSLLLRTLTLTCCAVAVTTTLLSGDLRWLILLLLAAVAELLRLAMQHLIWIKRLVGSPDHADGATHASDAETVLAAMAQRNALRSDWLRLIQQ